MQYKFKKYSQNGIIIKIKRKIYYIKYKKYVLQKVRCSFTVAAFDCGYIANLLAILIDVMLRTIKGPHFAVNLTDTDCPKNGTTYLSFFERNELLISIEVSVFYEP